VDQDPDGLNNVCQSGAPLQVNRYYARSQRRIYGALLAACLPAQHGSRALDVGCGAGRWSRLMATSGFEVTGIDLQEDVLRQNRARYPHVRFERSSIKSSDPVTASL